MPLLLPLRPYLIYLVSKLSTEFFRHLAKSPPLFCTKFCVFYFVLFLVRKLFIFYTKGALNFRFRARVPKLDIHAFKQRPDNKRLSSLICCQFYRE